MTATLVGIGIATAVLAGVAHGHWGLIWLILPVLLIARRLTCYPGAQKHYGHED